MVLDLGAAPDPAVDDAAAGTDDAILAERRRPLDEDAGGDDRVPADPGAGIDPGAVCIEQGDTPVLELRDLTFDHAADPEADDADPAAAPPAEG